MSNTLRIKEAIKARGLTCQEVANRMGKSKSQFAQMMSGNLTWETIQKIAEAAECHPIDFMPPVPEGYVPLSHSVQQTKENDNICENEEELLKEKLQNLNLESVVTCPYCSKKFVLLDSNQ